jgi:hypothetical protein
LRSLAALVALLPFAVVSQAQSVTGTWIAIHDPQGIVLPHFEVLQIAVDRQTNVIVYAPRTTPELCLDEKGAVLPACRNPARVAAGKIDLGAGGRTLGLAQPQIFDEPMRGWGQPHDLEISQRAYWLGWGATWQIEHGGRHMVARRTSEVEVDDGGERKRVRFELTKTYHLVDAAFAGELHDLFEAMDGSLVGAMCLMSVVHPREQDFARLRNFVAPAAKVGRSIVSLRNRVLANQASDADLATLRWITELPKDVEGAKEVARRLGVNEHEFELYRREVLSRPESELPMAWPGAAASTDEIKACIARILP